MRLELDTEALPVAPETARVAAALGMSPAELAATGGEDYELLLLRPGGGADGCEAAVAVTWIGRATAGVPGVGWRGDPSAARWRGYEHLGAACASSLRTMASATLCASTA